MWATDRPRTAAEAGESLGGDLAYTTVRTILCRLVDKGLVRRLPSATRPYSFEPTMSEVDLDAQRMVELLSSSPDRAAVVVRLLDLLCDEERNVVRRAVKGDRRTVLS